MSSLYFSLLYFRWLDMPLLYSSSSLLLLFICCYPCMHCSNTFDIVSRSSIVIPLDMMSKDFILYLF